MGPFHEEFQRRRKSAGVSVTDVARECATSRAAVYAYEKGTRVPSVHTAMALLTACGYTLTVTPISTESQT